MSRTPKSPVAFFVDHRRALRTDLTAILLFALLARLAHRGDGLEFSIAGWLATALPFLVGVLVAYGILSVKRRGPLPVNPGGITVWLVTLVTGLAAWGVSHAAIPHWSFMIVAGLMSGLLLLGWRVFGTVARRMGSVRVGNRFRTADRRLRRNRAHGGRRQLR
ncbi:DUF3054 domain-containing protein [Corynebacterium antarcticum]|uniref:DUF3054 domain-containing protein n=1 Tax=Corynebacterium antarcticum TaxID=2800405 RepID=A0ABS1FIK5_9CORY|nr:DUF3054 domain-containing protein [Corynebacterium antarcticum]